MTSSTAIKHDTVGVFIFNDAVPAKVLLHCHRKFGKWMQPGGHIERWENPVEAAIRETKEETGIDVSAYLPRLEPLDDHVLVIPTPDYMLEEEIKDHEGEVQHFHIDMLYVIRIPEQTGSAVGDHESKNIAWFTADEVETLPMFDNVRILLRQEFAK